MTTDRRSRKRVRTADHITDVAFALFERHGYEAVTMERIAAEADVARATLYNHFPVKEAVLAHGLHAQLGRDLAPLMETVLSQGSFISRAATLLEASAHWWEQHRHYAAPYIRHRFQEVAEGHGEQASSDMVGAYAALIAHAQESGELGTEAPSLRLAHYLHFLYLSALMTWLGRPGTRLEDEFGHALDFFIRGASADSAPSKAGRPKVRR